MYNFLMLFIFYEPVCTGAAYFFAALVPDLFLERLRLLVFFFNLLRPQGAKNMRLRASPQPWY